MPLFGCASTRSAPPSFWLIMSEGMVTRRDAPPMRKISVPPLLLATIMPSAPAAWTFSAFTVKSQLPRSTRAIFPLTAEETVVQASAGDDATYLRHQFRPS